MMYTEGNCSEAEPYALQVLGDSMEPEFKEGCIVIIDPAGHVQDGVYVIAVHEEEYIFRQLRVEEKRFYLCALNSAYPRVEISGLDVVQGVIVQQAGRRRNDRKHYV